VTSAAEHTGKRQRAAAGKAIARNPIMRKLAEHAGKVQRQRDQAIARMHEAYELGAEDMRIRCLSVPGLSAQQCAAITAITAVPSDATEPEGSGSAP
jgi:hypothetical protein